MMRRQKRQLGRKSWSVLVAATLAFAVTAEAEAQSSDACVGLLRHGILDTFRQNGIANSASQAQREFCSSYQRYKLDRQAGSVQASYEVFSGGASFSRDQMESLGSAMCQSSFSSAQANAALTTFSSTIDPNGVAAYRDCVDRTRQGLQSDTQYDEDAGTGFSLTVYYVQPLGVENAHVRFGGITKSRDDGVMCSGNLTELQNGAEFKASHAYQLDCRREISASPSSYENRPVWAPPLTVTVGTSAGSIVRELAALPAGPPPTELSLPIGTIIAFSGTMAEANAQQRYGWWVADGRSVADPVAAAFFRKKTPDLSNRFLLGSTTSGEPGGSQKATIPAQIIDSHTTGGFGAPNVHSDMYTHLNGPHTWNDGAAIYSQGTFPATSISLPLQPYYKVIYLIKVK